MNIFDMLSKGFSIISTYATIYNRYIAAEHDIIYAGSDKGEANPIDMYSEDLKQMDELGWFWDESLETWCNYV